MSSSLARWQLNQEKLRLEYDSAAQGMEIPEVCGVLESPCEIVVVTPTPPIKSGIATYSSKLVSELNELVRVRVVSSLIESENSYFYPGIRATFPKEETSEITRKIVYMLGNGEHHWRTWDLLLRFPGYVVIHDASIPDIPLFEGEDQSWYQLTYQEKVVNFLGRIPLHTQGIYCHSETAAELVKLQLRRYQIERIPVKVLSTGHPTDFVEVAPRSPTPSPIIGTFGFQTQNKNPALTYKVISKIAAEVKGRGLICGKIDKQTSKLAEEIWLKNGNPLEDLTIVDWADETTYKTLMSQVDLGVQLRSSSNGESSGPLSELNSQGIPTVVTDIGTFSEIPDNFPGVFKLPLGVPDTDLENFLRPIVDLINDPATYFNASFSLIDSYKNKTYKRLAQELVGEFFK